MGAGLALGRHWEQDEGWRGWEHKKMLHALLTALDGHKLTKSCAESALKAVHELRTFNLPSSEGAGG